MKTLTPAMREALSERGFVKDGSAWRLDRRVLPVAIYQDKHRHSPVFGIGVSIGGPNQRLAGDEGGVVTVGQRTSAGGPGFFYDFDQPNAQDLCERDFFAVTVPLSDLVDPTELGQALLRGDYQSVHYWPRPFGGVYAALELADAYQLEGLFGDIAERLHEVTRDPLVYDEIVTVVHDWPDRVPRLASMVAAVPPPPLAEPATQRGGRGRFRFSRRAR